MGAPFSTFLSVCIEISEGCEQSKLHLTAAQLFNNYT